MQPDPDALVDAIATLKLTLEADAPGLTPGVPVHGMLRVTETFHDFIVEVLRQGEHLGVAGGRPAVAIMAAVHGRAIADFLVAVTLDDAPEPAAQPAERIAEAVRKLTVYWMDAIANACLRQEPPIHESEIEYVRGAAALLNIVAQVLLPERFTSAPPADISDKCGADEEALTASDACSMLVISGAAALCIAATLEPEYRIASHY